MRFVILATGESMSQELANSLKGERRICVNNAYELAADADALCANDRAWWAANPKAMLFAGRRFSTQSLGRGVEQINDGVVSSASNSALLALHVAVKVFGATEVRLYGVDMHGSHYFGPYQGLKNTLPHRFEVFKQQFAAYAARLRDVNVINCSSTSKLECFPFAT